MPPDLFTHWDAVKILVWLVPGAFIALFRSFAMRGSFPSVGKDDVAALVLGSVLYWFVLGIFTSSSAIYFEISSVPSPQDRFFTLVLGPAIIGAGLGYVEAGDIVGDVLRRFGIRLPSPDATAWETMFRELRSGSIVVLTLKDGATVTGEWVGGRRGSASSSDPSSKDLYLGRIGSVSDGGAYEAYSPRRGAYITADQIRTIEVIYLEST